MAAKHSSDGTVEQYTDEKQVWVDAAFTRADAWAEATGWTP